MPHQPLLLVRTSWHPPSPHLFPYTTLFRSRYPLLRSARTFCPSTNAGRSWPATVDGRLGVPCSAPCPTPRSEEHTSELQSRRDLVCRLLLEKKKQGDMSLSIDVSSMNTYRL